MKVGACIRGVHEVEVKGNLGVNGGHCWNLVKMLTLSIKFNGFQCNLDEEIIEWDKLGIFRNQSKIMEGLFEVIVKTRYAIYANSAYNI